MRPTSARDLRWGETLFGDTRRGQAAQVDDPAHPGGAGLLTEDAGRLPVGLLEVMAHAQGVHQVVRDVDAAQGLGDQ